MTTDAMLEHAANYLLNHCFVLGSVEDQRADALPVHPGSPWTRCGRFFGPAWLSGGAVPGPLQAAALVNEHEGQPGQIVEIREHTTLVLRLLYLQKRESLDTAAEQVLVTVEEVQAELQK